MSKTINLVNQKIRLDFVSFKRLPNPSSLPEALIIDDVHDFELIDNKISFKYNRTLKVEPESIYEVRVVFSYESDISSDSIQTLKENNQLNKEYLEKEVSKIVDNTNMCAVASQIISNLTGVNNNHPFISPPVFLKKNK